MGCDQACLCSRAPSRHGGRFAGRTGRRPPLPERNSGWTVESICLFAISVALVRRLGKLVRARRQGLTATELLILRRRPPRGEARRISDLVEPPIDPDLRSPQTSRRRSSKIAAAMAGAVAVVSRPSRFMRHIRMRHPLELSLRPMSCK